MKVYQATFSENKSTISILEATNATGNQTPSRMFLQPLGDGKKAVHWISVELTKVFCDRWMSLHDLLAASKLESVTTKVNAKIAVSSGYTIPEYSHVEMMLNELGTWFSTLVECDSSSFCEEVTCWKFAGDFDSFTFYEGESRCLDCLETEDQLRLTDFDVFSGIDPLEIQRVRNNFIYREGTDSSRVRELEDIFFYGGVYFSEQLGMDLRESGQADLRI